MSRTAFSELLKVLDDQQTLPYQVTRDGGAVDITGWAFSFAVKELPEDVGYIIDPVAGDIDDAAEGEFSFDVLFDTLVESGVYEITATVGGKKTTLTPGNGVKIQIVESIID